MAAELMRWFPFYVDRFLTSKRVRRMDAERIGVYLLLLCEQWDNGVVPNDDDDLILIAKSSIDVVRDVLACCFKQRRKGWINDTLEEVRKEQYGRAERLRVAGQIAGYRSGEARRKRKKNNDLERPFNDRSTTVERNRTKRREEKILEEKRSTATAGARASKSRWRFVPDDWRPTEKHAAMAAELHVDLALEEARFRDHEFKQPKSDPDRTFANWLRGAPQYANGNGAARATPDASEKLRGKANDTAEALRRMGIE